MVSFPIDERPDFALNLGPRFLEQALPGTYDRDRVGPVTAKGDTLREIRRGLKCYFARETYQRLDTSASTGLTT